MLTNNKTARDYLKSLGDSEIVRKYEGDSSGHPALYHSIRACLEEVDTDKFLAIATTSLISNNVVPEFLLTTQISASNPSENAAYLDDVHTQLKSLAQITNKNGIRFFSCHSFTQYVMKDMVNDLIKEKKSVQADLQRMCFCENMRGCICENMRGCICENMRGCICENMRGCICENMRMCFCENMRGCICENMRGCICENMRGCICENWRASSRMMTAY